MRKTFLLGGHPYTAPDPIGAGIRARAKQITDDIADEKKAPHDTESIIERYYYDYSLRILEVILTPSDGSPSVKEAYDSATDEEVRGVMDFFAVNVSGKTLSELSKTKDLPATKRTPKAKV